ncbi:putative portal protein [Escherichia phage vB_EcoP_PhAPEC5]|uniref:Putative portal protein n=1 Tax=Escherichia phage vB_EcoP_PhAPEC5 TaxID=1395983 RepID=A0A067Y1B1_9CAUD|nr:portal protein [Escherichia phage vB_EcoP_PhAPEC5]AGV99347.1 putative portal protein [Escherichia phage vB_EcoP_PhAPEC5]
MEHQDTFKPLPDPAQSEKLTDWKKEPSIQLLKGDLESAKPAHDAIMSQIREWNDLMEVKGKAKPPKVKGRSQVQPRLVRRQAEWRYAPLSEPFLSSSKLFKLTPVTFEDELAARQNELVLNYQFRTQLNKVKLVDDYVHSVVDDGTGIARIGWERKTVKIKTETPVFQLYPIENQEQADVLQQALQLQAENPREYDETMPEDIKEAVNYFNETGEATYAIQTGVTEVEVEKALVNRPTVEMLNPNNVVIDPSCNGDLDKALYAVISFETCKADLMKNKDRYHNLDKIDWESSSPMTDPDHESKTPSDFQFKDALRKKVVAYEYWGFYDIDDDGSLEPIVATWIGSTLIRMEKNPFPDGKLPLVVVPYMPRKRELFGEADAELLGDNQAILGATMRGMIDLLGRSANGQRGYPKGMLDTLNRRRYDDGQDYEYNPMQGNPSQSIMEHKFPELPQSAIVMTQMQNQEAESLTGVKAFSGGVTGSAYGDVAAGIRGALDAASKREMAILRRLAKGMADIGTKICAMNAVFLSEKEVVRITNEQYVEINREDLKGNFDIEVDINTAEIDNQKSQDLSFMVQTLGNTVDQTITLSLVAKIAELKRMPDLAHELRTWQPQPDPMEEQLKQLAIQKAQLENEELQSKIALNMAKAKEAASAGDLKDLDYLEQESGTKHARDMEKQKAQSQGNQNLQITKALTTPIKEGETTPNISAAVGYNTLTDGNSPQERDIAAQQDPAYSLGSQYYDPSQDPSSALGMNL